MKFSDLNLLAIGNTIQLAGVIWSGEDGVYLCMLPGDHGQLASYEGAPLENGYFQDVDGGEQARLEVLNLTHKEWGQFIRQSDTMETEVLAQASDGTLAKVILRKSQRQIEAAVQWRVWRRDGCACRYCGRNDTPLTVDHLVCWEEGGPSIEANLVAADKSCNKRRGNLPYAQWLEHPYYKKVSAALTEEQRAANRKLIETLDAIPRMLHIRSR